MSEICMFNVHWNNEIKGFVTSTNRTYASQLELKIEATLFFYSVRALSIFLFIMEYLLYEECIFQYSTLVRDLDSPLYFKKQKSQEGQTGNHGYAATSAPPVQIEISGNAAPIDSVTRQS